MVEARVDAFFGELQRNPVIPAVRGSNSALRTALKGPHAAVFVLGGDIFRVLERVKAAGGRPPVCINVDLVGGVSTDARAGCGSSSADRGCDLPAPARNRASQETDLLTIHRLFAIASGTVERGVKLIRSAQPH